MVKKNKKKVLIVEDDKDFLAILEIKFLSEGFSVVSAEDGQQGVSMAQSEKPDVIISDVVMPRMDGIEMAKKIRETDKKTVIIFLTNIKDIEYTRKIEESGDFGYLVKSDLRIGEIVNRVKQRIGLK